MEVVFLRETTVHNVNYQIGDTGNFSEDISTALILWGDAELASTVTETSSTHIITVINSYTATNIDETIICNKGTAMTVTLPAATASGKKYTISNIGGGDVTIEGDDTDTIDSQLTQTIEQWESIDIVDYGLTTWKIT